jgi:D-tyrosyl-tRNA(Tyr) deacylase
MAASPKEAERLFSLSFSLFQNFIPTKTGIFGKKMLINLLNNGPVTIILDSREKRW